MPKPGYGKGRNWTQPKFFEKENCLDAKVGGAKHEFPIAKPPTPVADPFQFVRFHNEFSKRHP